MKDMTTEQRLLVIILNEVRETKVRARIAQKLAERMLIHHGEQSADVSELVAQLKKEADSERISLSARLG